MPYEIGKVGGKYVVYNPVTGGIHSRHKTRDKARRQLTVVRAIEYGWRRKRRSLT